MSGHIQDLWTSPDPTNSKKRVKSPRYGSGKRWRAVWTEPDGTRRTKTFSLKDEAKSYLDGVSGQMRGGEYVSSKQGAITVSELAPEWLESKRKLRPGTIAEVRGRLNNHVIPRWGSYPINEITHKEIQEWITTLAGGASSVQKAHRTLAGILEYAVRTERLQKNLARGIELPVEGHAEQRFLTHSEFWTLLKHVDPHWKDFTSMMFHTGLRMGEGVELRVKDVHLARKRVKVERSANRLNGIWVVGPTKNGEPREAPLTATAVEILERRIQGKKRDELVFTNRAGHQIDRTGYRRVFVDAAEASGIGRLTPHDMRHTAASWAISAGASPKLVQLMLGHRSAAITLDIYAGLFDRDIDSVVLAMDALERTAHREHTESQN